MRHLSKYFIYSIFYKQNNNEKYLKTFSSLITQLCMHYITFLRFVNTVFIVSTITAIIRKKMIPNMS
jgi:hypothetical protein